jgi:predicted DNA binding CopG/RHH family protein
MKIQRKIKKNNPYNVKLDPEEQALLESYEHGKWKSVDNLTKKMKEAKEIAANTLRKDARITRRISSSDLARLKQNAAYKGLPYQTYISSVLHEYAAGHFGATAR